LAGIENNAPLVESTHLQRRGVESSRVLHVAHISNNDGSQHPIRPALKSQIYEDLIKNFATKQRSSKSAKEM